MKTSDGRRTGDASIPFQTVVEEVVDMDIEEEDDEIYFNDKHNFVKIHQHIKGSKVPSMAYRKIPNIENNDNFMGNVGQVSHLTQHMKNSKQNVTLSYFDDQLR